MGLEDAAAVRALWRHQRELERVLADRLAIELVKAETLCELEEVTEVLRQSPWLSQHGAERSARAVAAAIRRFYVRLAGAGDAEGKPDVVLRAFALHLHEYLLVPSGRAGAWARAQAVPGSEGSFIYQPPPGVVWRVEGGRESARALIPVSQGSRGRSPSQPASESNPCRPAAVGYLSRFLCVGLALALLATGCVGPRPLKGGRAVTTHKPAGIIEQTLVQGENPSQATKQDQETVKVRTYTVPAGSRMEQSQVWEGERLPVPRRLHSGQPAIPNEPLGRAHIPHLDQAAATLLDKRNPLAERVSRPHLDQIAQSHYARACCHRECFYYTNNPIATCILLHKAIHVFSQSPRIAKKQLRPKGPQLL